VLLSKIDTTVDIKPEAKYDSKIKSRSIDSLSPTSIIMSLWKTYQTWLKMITRIVPATTFHIMIPKTFQVTRQKNHNEDVVQNNHYTERTIKSETKTYETEFKVTDMVECSDKTWKYSLCKFTSSDKPSLMRHIITMHTNIKMYK